MPRNASGTYSLPAGNPVVSLTTITSTWANDTMADLATAITQSLSRAGEGAMLAPLRIVAGNSAAPGIAFSVETTTGLYRAGTGDVRLGIAGADLLKFVANLAQLQGTAPAFRLRETDAAADNKDWDFIATAEDLKFRVLLDAGTPTEYMKVERTAGVVDKITLTGATIDFVGTSVEINGVPITIPSGAFAYLDVAQEFTEEQTFSNGLIVSGGADFTFNWLSSGLATFLRNGTLATDPSVLLSSAGPRLRFTETDAANNNKIWDFLVNGEALSLNIVNDANGIITPIMTFERTGTTSDGVTFAGAITGNGSGLTTLNASNISAGTLAAARLPTNVALLDDAANFTAGLQSEGVDVGWRDLPISTTSGTLVAADRGKMVVITAGITAPASVFAAEAIVSIYNNSAGALNLTRGSGLTMYRNGSDSATVSIPARDSVTLWFRTATECVVK